MAGNARACGECSLCCTVLRVDELRKLGGVACPELRAPEAGGGCGIHARRPGVCRAYRCLWLGGGLEEGDRPDRLGAVLDVVTVGTTTLLEIREAEPGAFERSPRLREIAAQHRRAMPVRILDVGDVHDPDRAHRVLLPDGSEERIAGESVEIWRDGERIARGRMPWFERLVRRGRIAWRRWRFRRYDEPGVRRTRRP